jgi:hypothetical protein
MKDKKSLDEQLGDDAVLQKIDGAKQQIHEWDFNEMLNARTRANQRKESTKNILRYITTAIICYGGIAAGIYATTFVTPYIISGYDAVCKKYIEKFIDDAKSAPPLTRKSLAYIHNTKRNVSPDITPIIIRHRKHDYGTGGSISNHQHSVTIDGVVTNSIMVDTNSYVPIGIETNGQNTTITTGSDDDTP